MFIIRKRFVFVVLVELLVQKLPNVSFNTPIENPYRGGGAKLFFPSGRNISFVHTYGRVHNSIPLCVRQHWDPFVA